MSKSDIFEKDLERISYLKEVRKNALTEQGIDSRQFKKIDSEFQKALRKYDLFQTEYVVGWLPKKGKKLNEN